MNKKKYTYSILLSSTLILALLLPTTLQFFHSFEKHQHLSCKEVKTHIHEQNFDCSLCDFHFAGFDFQVEQKLSVIDSEIFSRLQLIIVSSGNNEVSFNFYLRGPPQLS